MDTEILHTVGDDPITELMDVDRFYGWTRRIGLLKGILQPRKRSKLPYILIITFSSLLLGCIGAIVYLQFFY